MSRLCPDEPLAYQTSVLNDVALFDSIRTGREEGHEEGREEGRVEGEAIGLEKGRKEGLVEGREEEKRSIARNLKSMGLSVQQIRQASGLTLEEIEQL